MESTCCSIVSNVLTTFSGRSTFCTFPWTSLDRKYFPLLDSFTSSGRDTTTGWSGILSESLLPPPPPNKQASKQEENKTHGKSNDVQGIHLFEPIFKTTHLSLSLSLSLAVYFFCFDVYLQTLLMASVHHLNLSAAKCAFVDFFATWSSSQFSA